VFSWTILKEIKTAHYKPGEWNAIKVRVETNRIVGFVNGERVMEVAGESLRGGKAGLAKFRDTRAQFKGFQIGRHLEQPVTRSASPSDLAAAEKELRESAGRTDAELIASLESNRAVTRPLLLEHANRLDKEAQQMRRVAAALHAKATTEALVEALHGPEEHIDLFQAALLVAKLDNAELDIKPYRTELKRMAQEIQRGIGRHAGDRERLDALVRLIQRRDPRAVARVLRILVAEDNPHITELLCSGLGASAKRTFGDDLAFAFATAENGASALQLLRDVAFDLAIIDVYLPVLDGTKVIDQVRSELGLQLPIIAISEGGESARNSAIRAGADVFLAKPMRLREVFDSMRQLVPLSA
jgi:CheY-like chemotaxis protein